MANFLPRVPAKRLRIRRRKILSDWFKRTALRLGLKYAPDKKGGWMWIGKVERCASKEKGEADG